MIKFLKEIASIFSGVKIKIQDAFNNVLNKNSSHKLKGNNNTGTMLGSPGSASNGGVAINIPSQNVNNQTFNVGVPTQPRIIKLSIEAEIILYFAQIERFGEVTSTVTSSGTQFQGGQRFFYSGKDNVLVAKWEKALEQLQSRGFVKEQYASNCKYWKITSDGFENPSTLPSYPAYELLLKMKNDSATNLGIAPEKNSMNSLILMDDHWKELSRLQSNTQEEKAKLSSIFDELANNGYITKKEMSNTRFVGELTAKSYEIFNAHYVEEEKQYITFTSIYTFMVWRLTDVIYENSKLVSGLVDGCLKTRNEIIDIVAGKNKIKYNQHEVKVVYSKDGEAYLRSDSSNDENDNLV